MNFAELYVLLTRSRIFHILWLGCHNTRRLYFHLILFEFCNLILEVGVVIVYFFYSLWCIVLYVFISSLLVSSSNRCTNLDIMVWYGNVCLLYTFWKKVFFLSKQESYFFIFSLLTGYRKRGAKLITESFCLENQSQICSWWWLMMKLNPLWYILDVKLTLVSLFDYIIWQIFGYNYLT